MRLPLLTGGPRDAPARQQTLRATIEWSAGLLPENTQTVFRRLGVFRGSFAVAAAEAIADADLDTLQTLLDHSLVRRVADERLVIHETIRQWAVEELERRAELTEARIRHGRYYTEWAISTRDDPKAREALEQTYPQEEGEHLGRARRHLRPGRARPRIRSRRPSRELSDQLRAPGRTRVACHGPCGSLTTSRPSGPSRSARVQSSPCFAATSLTRASSPSKATSSRNPSATNWRSLTPR